MNKKFLLGSVLMAASLSSTADDLNYLTVGYNNVEQSIELSTVQKITFEEGNAVVYTTGETYTYPLSEMQKMTFTQDPTAIKSLPTESDDLKFLNGQLSVSGKGTLRVYNASGALIRMANIEKKSNVSLNGLKPGLYVISMGDQTIKITK